MKKLCIAVPQLHRYSETFIHNHLKYLPANIHTLHLNNEVLTTDGQRPLMNRSLTDRIWLYIQRKTSRVNFDDQQRKKLCKYLTINNINFFLAEFGTMGARVYQACKQANVPLIVHFHGHDAYKESILNWFGKHYPPMFDVAKAVIVVSRDMARQVEKLGAPKEKIFYNPYGVDIELFKQADIASNPVRFIAVGRFVHLKAPYLSILAFKKVHEKIPEACLLMVGDGPLRSFCEELAAVSGLRDKVQFAGIQSNEEVARLMQSSYAFVQHSQHLADGEAEGTPVALLEAGASGLPVVSTRHTGIQDVIIEGKTGFLVEEGDIDQMAAHMVYLAQNRQVAIEMGTHNRQQIINKYTLKQSIDRLWEIIYA